MAKQTGKQSAATAQQKPSNKEGFSAFNYLLKNSVIVVVIGILLLIIYKKSETQGQLGGLIQQFNQMQQQGAPREQLEPLYNQIIEIQNDTSFFSSVTRGYYFAVHDLAIKNLEQIREIESKATKPLTREEKLAYKVGFYPFLEYINKNTPENAVLLLPEGDSILSNNSRWNFIYEPEWMEYWIYPRLCVARGREDAQPGLAEKVTHVVIVGGKGYDKLKYDVPVEQRVSEAVLPINQPPTQNTN
jgi:hypothetical protein